MNIIYSLASIISQDIAKKRSDWFRIVRINIQYFYCQRTTLNQLVVVINFFYLRIDHNYLNSKVFEQHVNIIKIWMVYSQTHSKISTDCFNCKSHTNNFQFFVSQLQNLSSYITLCLVDPRYIIASVCLFPKFALSHLELLDNISSIIFCKFISTD